MHEYTITLIQIRELKLVCLVSRLNLFFLAFPFKKVAHVKYISYPDKRNHKHDK